MRKKWILFFTALTVSIVIAVGVVALLTLGGNRLIVEVSTDKLVYDIDETVAICIKLINPTTSPKTLHFISGYQVDYRIMQDSTVLYEWSADKTFIQAFTSITIPPFDSVTRCFNHTPQDYPLTPRTYQIEGLAVGYDKDRTNITISE